MAGCSQPPQQGGLCSPPLPQHQPQNTGLGSGALRRLECWDSVKHSKENAELSLQLVYVLQSLGC